MNLQCVVMNHLQSSLGMKRINIQNNDAEPKELALVDDITHLEFQVHPLQQSLSMQYYKRSNTTQYGPSSEPITSSAN